MTDEKYDPEKHRRDAVIEHWKDPIRVLRYCQELFRRIHRSENHRILDEEGIVIGAYTTGSAARKIDRILEGVDK